MRSPGGGEEVTIDAPKSGESHRDRHEGGKHPEEFFTESLRQAKQSFSTSLTESTYSDEKVLTTNTTVYFHVLSVLILQLKFY